MIDLIQGPSQSVLSDGSHPLLGQAFNVHEESGYRSAFSRTAYKVMTVDTTSSAPVPSVHQCNICRGDNIGPDRPQPGTVLRPSRPLRAASRRWPAASLDGLCARCRSGRGRDEGMVPLVEQRDDPMTNLLTPHLPYKDEVVCESLINKSGYLWRTAHAVAWL